MDEYLAHGEMLWKPELDEADPDTAASVVNNTFNVPCDHHHGQKIQYHGQEQARLRSLGSARGKHPQPGGLYVPSLKNACKPSSIPNDVSSTHPPLEWFQCPQ